MKILGLFLAMCAGCFGQAPEGWEKVVAAEGEDSEVWASKDRLVLAEITQFEKFPKMEELMGFGPGADFSQFPTKVESLKAPGLGLRFWFERGGSEMSEERVIFQQDKGWKLLTVSVKKGGAFDLKPWVSHKANEVFEKVWRERCDRIVKELTMLLGSPPEIKTDVSLKPPVQRDRKREVPEHEVRVEISIKGGISHEGKAVTEDQLEKIFAGKVEKFGEGKSLLHIAAAKETDFTFIREVIRLAKKSGIEQVAFGAMLKEEKKVETR